MVRGGREITTRPVGYRVGMEVAVVFNPVSGAGRARRAAALIEAGLACEGIASRTIESAPTSAESWLRPRLSGAAAVVVAGGDGAVRTVAPEAARAGVPLWAAPCGTENLVARAFGTCTDPRRIASALRRGQSRPIDLPSVGGAPFVVMASVGFDADVVHLLAARRAGAISHLSYAGPIFAAMRDWRPSDLVWEVDGERERLGPGMVVVANLREYGVRLDPAAGAVPDDRLLDAVFIPAGSAASLAAWVPLLWSGLHRHHRSLRERRGSRVVVESDPPVRLQIDGDAAGDPSGSSRLAFEMTRERLRMLLPAG